MNNKVILEKVVEDFVKSTSKPPFVFELPFNKGRELLEQAQDSLVYKYPARIISTTLNTGDKGVIKVYLVVPSSCNPLPHVIFYIHGGGWVFGSFHTHEKLVRELSCRTNSIVIFPEYSRSPEVKFPVAIEQCYSVMCQIPYILKTFSLNADLSNFTVAGDSVGGNMAIAMTLISKYNHGPKISKQLLYYPVTNARFDTSSYQQFAQGYYLYRDGMKWFWNQYAPNLNDRNSILASPLQASIKQLEGLPDAMIINGEADVLRDEGKLYADKLQRAGNDVTAICIKGTIHDFVMLNSLDKTNATRIAMDSSVMWINRKNNEKDSICD